MIRTLILLTLLIPLTACQGLHSPDMSPPTSDTFNQDTTRTYDPQTREFQAAKPPYGSQSNRSQ